MNVKKLTLLRLELLKGCPLACVHCSAESGPGRLGEVPAAQVIELLRSASDLGAERVIFTGGEPLEYLDLVPILDEAKSLSLRPTVYTTGIRGTGPNKWVDRRLLKAVSTLADRLVFSFYSADSATHDNVTGFPGSLALTNEALSIVKEEVLVDISFLPLNGNWPDLLGVAQLAENNGVEEVRVLKLMRQGRAARARSLSDPDPEEFAEVLRESRCHTGTRIRLGGAAALYGNGTECLAGDSEVFRNADGWVSACPGAYPMPADPFSNCFQVGLDAVWQRSHVLEAVRLLSGLGDNCRQGCLARKACLRRLDSRLVDIVDGAVVANPPAGSGSERASTR